MSALGSFALGLVTLARSAMAFNTQPGPSIYKGPGPHKADHSQNVTFGIHEEHQWWAEKNYWPDIARKWLKCTPVHRDHNYQHSSRRRSLDPRQEEEECVRLAAVWARDPDIAVANVSQAQDVLPAQHGANRGQCDQEPEKNVQPVGTEIVIAKSACGSVHSCLCTTAASACW